MLHSVNAPVGGPAGSASALPRLFGTSWGARGVLPGPADGVSDEQIRALIDAADRLGQRQRAHCAVAGSAASVERLLNLDWAVHAGGLALADRAARGLTSTAGAAQPRWVQQWGRFHP